MRIAVVILNWNTKDYLRRFLPPLLDSVRQFNNGHGEAAEQPSVRNTTDGVVPEQPSVRNTTDGVAAGLFRNVNGDGMSGNGDGMNGNGNGDGNGMDGGADGFSREYDRAEVIVADNASEDGSREILATEFPEVRTILLDRNYGFTGGYNRALKALSDDAAAAAHQGGRKGGGFDLYVLMNSDIEVTENWLRPLADRMKSRPDCGACGPKLRSWYRRGAFEYAGAAGGLIDRYGYPFCRGRVPGKVETDSGQYDSPADVLWVSGACLAVRAEVWNALGGFDDRFFAHMEEIDLCWRMQLEGWRVTAVPESVVYHLGGGTLPQTSPQKLYLNYRNNLLLLDNNLARTIGKRRAALRIFIRKVLDGCSAAVYLLCLKTDYFKAVWRAHRDAAKLKDADRDRLRLEPDGREVRGLYGGCIIIRALLGLQIPSVRPEEDITAKPDTV